jgi:hypothetical protein
MLESLRKWFDARANAAQSGAWRDVDRWADARGHSFRRVRDGDGFVVDGRLGATSWRLEWGPSQRSYVHGPELRVRADLPAAWDLQALVLSRVLQEAMEKDVFDQYVEGVQTRVDTQTPPEMRWLVMYPKLAGHELRALREDWAAVSNHNAWLKLWLDGPLSAALAPPAPAGGAPMALMIARGKLVLRMAMPAPDCAAFDAALGIFEVALREGRRVAADFTEPVSPSTQPSLFSPSTMPVDAGAH